MNVSGKQDEDRVFETTFSLEMRCKTTTVITVLSRIALSQVHYVQILTFVRFLWRV